MWPFARRDPPAARIEPTIRNASLENPSTSLADPDIWLTEALGGGLTYAGPPVSETSAMRSAVVFRCVSLKSGTVASLPIEIYERTAAGRRRAIEHPLYPLLHDDPNDLMSGFVWKELIEANLMLAGNHYSVMEMTGGGRVIGIIPVQPLQVDAQRVRGRNRYTIRLTDGTEVLDQDEIIHVPGIGFDGLKGLSPIAWAGKQPVGISLAIEEFVGRMHSNGARPSGVIEVPPGMDAIAFRRMKAEWDALYGGAPNAGKTMFVDQGVKWNQMQMTMEDAQTLESRRFQAADIARLFGVPLHMIGETTASTSWGTGIEQMTIGFQKFSIDPDVTRIEGELNRKLFTAPFYCEFNREALNAMDAKTQAELYASGVNNARFTPNEIRRASNLPDKEGGDDLYINSTMVPLRTAGQAPAEPTTEPPAA